MQKPLPRMTPIDRAYWEAANEGRLIIQKCGNTRCGRFIFYPRVCCPFCGGGQIDWAPASGRGEILSYTLVHRPQHESFYAEAPACFVAVKLEEGPLVYGELRPTPTNDSNLVGQSVQSVFLDHANGRRLPYFEILSDPAADGMS